MPTEDIYAALDELYAKIERMERQCNARGYTRHDDTTIDRLCKLTDELESWLTPDEWVIYQSCDDPAERLALTA